LAWHINELKLNVSKLYGEAQRKVLDESLDSIFENQDFSRFHYAEVQRRLQEHMIGKSSSHDYVRLILTEDKDVLNAEYEFNLAYRANVFALLKNLHSVTDFLAHVIYYSFGLNTRRDTSIQLDKLNLYHTKKSLEKVGVPDSLMNLLISLTEHDDYVYLKDLVNHTKHRSNILSKLTYDSNKTGTDIYQMAFLPFEKHGSVAVNEFLHREYNRQSELIIDIGQQINHSVRCLLAKCSRV